MSDVTPSQMYRLPWSLNDNVLGWLEPTKRCNLYCEGCYSRNDANSDKSVEQIRDDLRVIVSQRKVDSISIAGGDPLVHPEIVAVVRLIREEFGLKPVINTNGLALDQALLNQLVRAGIAGFTFHIDSTQRRPKWKGASEQELNALRLHYAQMVRRAGDVSVAFNSTVTFDTLKHVPELVCFAEQNIDLVDSMVFILFRTAQDRRFEYFAQGKRVDASSLVYYHEDAHRGRPPLTVNDVVREIRSVHPDYSPAAYLGGTKDPDSMKWVLATRIGSRGKIHGYLGPKSQELFQSGHHALFGRYVAYARPSTTKHGRLTALALSPIDKGARRIVTSMLKAPGSALERQYVQSLVIIQPIDTLPDGEMNMCDGCPDMTVHQGRLVWSCRLDEQVQHSCFLTAAPKAAACAGECTAQVAE